MDKTERRILKHRREAISQKIRRGIHQEVTARYEGVSRKIPTTKSSSGRTNKWRTRDNVQAKCEQREDVVLRIRVHLKESVRFRKELRRLACERLSTIEP